MNRILPALLLACCVQVCQAQPPGGLSLRTNLLYDAAVIPNVGAEWGIADRWSMTADAMYIWLKNDSRHRYWRIAGADVEVRRWLGDAASLRREGFHVGGYAAVLRYDLEFGGTGQRSDFNWSVGGAAGYLLPVGSRLSLDFGLSIGYVDGKYKKYSPEGSDYMWEADYRRRYFGPTKAEVALVWDIWPGDGGGSGGYRSHHAYKAPKPRKGGYRPSKGYKPKKGGWGW